ncbi:MAG: BatD family protein, partial [Myxococcota bacterium]
MASVVVEPDRAVPGQQIQYRVRILSREDVVSVEWIVPPSFPGFRTESLPGRLEPEPVKRAGIRYHDRRERRALFAEQTGSFSLRSAGLRCNLPGAPAYIAPVPDGSVQIVAAPRPGRPPHFSGLIGPIVMNAIVEPRAIALGQSVRLAITLRGPGNLWDAPDPIAGFKTPANTDWFPRAPELHLDSGASLSVRRHFSYDVVPRETGKLLLPEIRIWYFDPETGRYATVSAPAVEVRVMPPEPQRAPTEADLGEPPVRVSPAAPRTWTSDRSRSTWAFVFALGAGAIWAVTRRRRSGGARPALEEAEAARDRGDREDEAAALSRALREALARRLPEARTGSPEEILALPSLAPAERESAQRLA